MSDEELAPPPEHASAATILEEGLWLHAWVPVSAVIIVAALDPETGLEHLFWRRDDDASSWKHIGMVVACLDGLRSDVSEGVL